jgi:hypothetical protein
LASDGPKLLIFDDHMFECANSPAVANLFARGRSRWNVSIMLALQGIFLNQGCAKYLRTISRNATISILLPAYRDRASVSRFGAQTYGNSKAFMQVFDLAIRDNRHLIVCQAPNCPDKLRLRSGLLHGQTAYVYDV